MVTKVGERNAIDPEHMILASTRLRDFLVEMWIRKVSMPVYNPNRGKTIGFQKIDGAKT